MKSSIHVIGGNL